MLSLLFALVAATTVVDPDAVTMTSIVADVAGRVDGVSVVTRADVAQLLEMDARQQQLGCTDESASCVAEVAAALGAEIIVRAELGTIDDQRSLALSVLNSSDLTTTARAVIRGRNLSSLGDEVGRVLPDLIRKVMTTTTTTKSVRVFVTDVERTGIVGAATTEPPPAVGGGGLGWMVPVGVVGVVLGGIAFGAAGYSETLVAGHEAQVEDRENLLTAGAAKEQLSARDDDAVIAKAMWITGASLVVVGGVLFTVGMIE